MTSSILRLSLTGPRCRFTSTATAATSFSSAASAGWRRSGIRSSRGFRTSFRVIRFDQRGIGASTRGTPVDVDQLAQDAFAVLDHADSASALLVGHSTGGVILQTMALHEQRGSPASCSAGRGSDPTATWRSCSPRASPFCALRRANTPPWSAFIGYPPEWLDANWPGYEAMLAAAPVTPAQQAVVAERIGAILNFDRSAEVGGITVPQLIQGADDDLIVPAFLQRELARALPRAATHVFRERRPFFPGDADRRVRRSPHALGKAAQGDVCLPRRDEQQPAVTAKSPAMTVADQG